jgi:hypothetical protein
MRTNLGDVSEGKGTVSEVLAQGDSVALKEEERTEEMEIVREEEEQPPPPSFHSKEFLEFVEQLKSYYTQASKNRRGLIAVRWQWDKFLSTSPSPSSFSSRIPLGFIQPPPSSDEWAVRLTKNMDSTTSSSPSWLKAFRLRLEEKEKQREEKQEEGI